MNISCCGNLTPLPHTYTRNNTTHSSDNPAVLQVRASYRPGSTTATLALDPQVGANGEATISITVVDDQYEVTTRQFWVRVLPKGVDCVYSQWSGWGECSKSCGYGKQTRTRTIVTEGYGGGVSCLRENMSEFIDCNLGACRDPTLDVIADRSVVQNTPGFLEVFLSGITDGGDGGQLLDVRASTRDSNLIYDLSVQYRYPDTSAGLTYRLRDGVTGTAIISVTVADSEQDFISRSFRITVLPESRPRDCQWDWTAWSGCSATCGTGVQTRQSFVTRQPANGGVACPSPMPLEERTCSTNACPQNCEVAWGAWSPCSASCGGGTMQRTQIISKPSAFGGWPCPALRTETARCSETACPSDCEYSWSAWTSCSRTCGGGQRSRRRSILRYPVGGGASCGERDYQEYQACGTNECPVDCQYGWSEWSSCSRSCGGGVRTKSQIISVLASSGGVPCTPESQRPTVQEACNAQACTGSSVDPASCRGHCNSIAPAGCGCDTTCAQFNDCCYDYQSVCVSPGVGSNSCAGRCGDSTSESTCWCDDFCRRHGDCCADYESVCVSGATSSPAPAEFTTCQNRCFVDDRHRVPSSSSSAGASAEERAPVASTAGANNFLNTYLTFNVLDSLASGDRDGAMDTLIKGTAASSAASGNYGPLLATMMMDKDREFKPQGASYGYLNGNGMYGPSQVQVVGNGQYTRPVGPVPVASLVLAGAVGQQAGINPLLMASMVENSEGGDITKPIVMASLMGGNTNNANANNANIAPLMMASMMGAGSMGSMDPSTLMMASMMGGGGGSGVNPLLLASMMGGGNRGGGGGGLDTSTLLMASMLTRQSNANTNTTQQQQQQQQTSQAGFSQGALLGYALAGGFQKAERVPPSYGFGGYGLGGLRARVGGEGEGEGEEEEQESNLADAPPLKFQGLDSRFKAASVEQLETTDGQEEEAEEEAGDGFQVPEGFMSAVEEGGGAASASAGEKGQGGLQARIAVAQPKPQDEAPDWSYYIQMYEQEYGPLNDQGEPVANANANSVYGAANPYQAKFENPVAASPAAQPPASGLPTGRFTQRSFAPSDLYPNGYQTIPGPAPFPFTYPAPGYPASPIKSTTTTTTTGYVPVVKTEYVPVVHTSSYISKPVYVGAPYTSYPPYPPRYQPQQTGGGKSSLLDSDLLLPLLLSQSLAANAAAAAAPRAENATGAAAAACFCDQSCVTVGDCCADFVSLCSTNAQADVRAPTAAAAGASGVNAAQLLALSYLLDQRDQQEEGYGVVDEGSCRMRCGFLPAPVLQSQSFTPLKPFYPSSTSGLVTVQRTVRRTTTTYGGVGGLYARVGSAGEEGEGERSKRW